MTNSVFTLRLPEDTKASLDVLAKTTNRTKSFLVNKAIEEYVARNAWQVAALHEAVTQADAGRFVSEAAADAWLASWGSATELPPPAADVLPHRKP